MKVLLALSRSLDGAPAEDETMARTWPSGSVIRVLTVLHDQPLFVYTPEIATASTVPGAMLGGANDLGPTQRALVAEAAAVARSVARKSDTPGLAVERSVRHGTPGPEIVEEAKAWAADLIVLGVDSRAGLERLLSRNIDAYVVAHAPCSVEVVRGPLSQ